MSKTWKIAVPLLALATVIMLTVVNGDATIHPAQAKADAKDDALAALPAESELTEFKQFKRVHSGRTSDAANARVTSWRKADDAQLRVISTVADTEADAKALVQRATITQLGPGPMPKGSLTKRQIGQECYNSNRQAGPPQGAVTLVARDGRVVVFVQLAVPVTKQNGKFVKPTLTDSDVALVEKHALKVLEKLTQKGYTSKSKK